MLGNLADDVQRSALRLIWENGTPKKHGAQLREYLDEVADTPRWVHVAHTLAEMGDRDAIPIIMRHASSRTIPYSTPEMIKWVRVLTKFATPELLAKAKEIIISMLEGGQYISNCVADYLQKANRRDLEDVLALWFESDAIPQGWSDASPLAEAVGLRQPANDLFDPVYDGDIEMILYTAEMWFGKPITLPGDAEAGLADCVTGSFSKLPAFCWKTLEALVRKRGDDPDAWRTAWDHGRQPKGYRWRVLYAMTLFRALEKADTIDYTDAAAALAVLFQLVRDGDDERRVAEAENREDELVAILLEDRYYVLPGIVDEVAAFGEKYLPQFIDILGPEKVHWGLGRSLEVLVKLGRRNRAVVLPATQRLIETINDQATDYVLEKVSSVLQSIGLPAVPMIAEALPLADFTEEIFLSGVLSDIPCEETARILMDNAEPAAYAEDWSLSALHDIAAPSTVPYLIDAFSLTRSPEACEALYVTCEVNGIDNPYQDECEKIIAASENRMRSLHEQELAGFSTSGAEKLASRQAAGEGKNKAKKKKKKKMAKKSRKKNRRKKKKK